MKERKTIYSPKRLLSILAILLVALLGARIFELSNGAAPTEAEDMSAFEAEDMFELNTGVMVVSDEDASEEQALQYAQNALAARFGQAFSADANRLEVVARGQ